MIIPVRKPQTDKVARGPGTGESMAVGDYMKARKSGLLFWGDQKFQ